MEGADAPDNSVTPASESLRNGFSGGGDPRDFDWIEALAASFPVETDAPAACGVEGGLPVESRVDEGAQMVRYW